MSDRTYFQLYVWSCPPEQQEALRQALAGACDIDEDWFETAETDEIPWQLAIEEVTCGTASEIDTSALVAAAPEAVWEFWEDPKYEWLGMWCGYSSATGVVDAVCDTDGEALVTYGEAAAVLAGLPSRTGLVDPGAVLEALFPQKAFRLAVQAVVSNDKEEA